MIKNKDLLLGIKHLHQVKIPSVQEVLNNELLEQEIKDSFSKYKNKGDVEKSLKKIARKNKKKIVTEQIFLTDSLTNKQNIEASLIINIDKKQLVKNRYIQDEPEKIVELYIKRYQDKINQFYATYRK